jgi:hypothetical protein
MVIEFESQKMSSNLHDHSIYCDLNMIFLSNVGKAPRFVADGEWMPY